MDLILHLLYFSFVAKQGLLSFCQLIYFCLVLIVNCYASLLIVMLAYNNILHRSFVTAVVVDIIIL